MKKVKYNFKWVIKWVFIFIVRIEKKKKMKIFFCLILVENIRSVGFKLLVV